MIAQGNITPTLGHSRLWQIANRAGLTQADIARFVAKVETVEGDGCWLWRAGIFREGYGQFNAGRYAGKQKTVYAHRVAWELTRGPIPKGLFVCHHCDVRRCVRPDHLFLGTQADNLDDARRKGRLDESRPRRAFFTPEQRLAIHTLPDRPGLCVALARQFGVSVTCISQIRRGRFARLKPLDSSTQPYDQIGQFDQQAGGADRSVFHVL